MILVVTIAKSWRAFQIGYELRSTQTLYIDVFWYGVIQRGRSPFVRIALPSSLMLWLKVVPSDGFGILPLICAWPPRGCTI
jgi:hypothetical protein